MRNYALSLITHVTCITLLAIAGAFAVLSHLWFCTTACGVIIFGICISLYRLQTRQTTMMQRIVECMKNNDLSQLAYAPFNNRDMQRLASDMSEALKNIHTHLDEEEAKHQYYENLLNQVDTAVIVCHPNGLIDWMNQAAQQMLDNHNRLPEEIRSALSNKQAVARLPHSSHPVEVALSATQIQQKGKEYWLVSLKNIHTVVEHTEMEAWQKLIRVLTHEIMNSITPIISLAETLSERSEADADTHASKQMKQGLQIIYRRSKSLLEFVENYRKLTRIAPPVKSDIPVKDFFEDLRQLFADPRIIFNSPDMPLRWKADRGQMEQVFINLIKNAQEACSDNPSARISVCAHTTDEQWEFTVTDNGEGMLPEVTGRIFLPFFTTKPGGSGIGLALCKQITVLHGGQISVTTEPEKGSRFTLTFPM